jgi:hypothetical protein
VRRRRLIAALVSLVAVAIAIVLVSSGGGPAPVTPALGPPALPAPSGTELGANVNRLFDDMTYTDAQIDAQLAALQRTGATVARSDALWEATEPSPPDHGAHTYDWRFDDQIVGSLATHGLTLLPILDYVAIWDQSVPGQDHSPPRTISDYAAYAAAVAARYGPRGLFWSSHLSLSPRPIRTYEIWNEPDTGVFWFPAPDPGRYDDLYLAARNAIKAVDPGARVIVGGLTRPVTFVAALLSARAGIAAHIDGIAIHPYAPTPIGVLANVRGDRVALDALGLTRTPMYVTELGWSTSPPGTTKYAPVQLRPQFIESTMATLGRSDCGLGGVLLYTWVTPERNRRNLEDWYGVSPPGAAVSADMRAFAAGIVRASSGGPATRVCVT